MVETRVEMKQYLVEGFVLEELIIRLSDKQQQLDQLLNPYILIFIFH